MPWYPGNSKYYNETPSPVVALALSAGVMLFKRPESETHTGFNEFEGSAFTDSLNARPHVDNTAKRGIDYSRGVEVVSSSGTPPRKGK